MAAAAEYTLILVLAFLCWTGGFVDLATHTSDRTVILGMYTPAFAVGVLVYSLGYVVWGGLLFRRKGEGITLFKRIIAFVQQRSWLAAGIMLVFAAIVASMFVLPDRWVQFPLLEVCVLLLIVILTGTFILAHPFGRTRLQLWRKVAGGILGGWIVLELLMQVAAFLNVLPFDNLSGLYTSNGRVYHREGGTVINTQTNRLGAYYPQQDVDDSKTRIVLIGDTNVLGLEVKPEDNVGIKLQERIADSSQVFSLGFASYGPGIYADPRLVPYNMPEFKAKEVIVLFHLANDLQTSTGPGGSLPHYNLSTDGIATVVDDDFQTRHVLQHLSIRGYEPINPIVILQSNSYSVQLLRKIFNFGYTYRDVGDTGVAPFYPLNIDASNSAQPFGKSTFAFDKRQPAEAKRALVIAESQLIQMRDRLAQEGIALRLVTIPYFPASFYTQQGNNWTTELNEYDLSLPERALAEFANKNNIPFLPMVDYLKQSGASVNQIQNLYLNNGTGNFTIAGHDYFANAMYACFYADGASCPITNSK